MRVAHALLLGSSSLLLGPAITSAQQGSVVDTVHNLSVSGPGEIKSLTERQVCKFCHVPHSSTSPVPMWSRRLSLEQYQTPKITGEGGTEVPAPQPDGSSRLCLSCHDGTIALGEVAGGGRPIEVAGAPVLRPGRRGFLGTDLSGSHPISIEIPRDSTLGAIENTSDLALKSAAEIRADPRVRLDDSDKMQCTTCHDPHSDQYFVEDLVPRFWIAPSVSEVCLSCHSPA